MALFPIQVLLNIPLLGWRVLANEDIELIAPHLHKAALCGSMERPVNIYSVIRDYFTLIHDILIRDIWNQTEDKK